MKLIIPDRISLTAEKKGKKYAMMYREWFASERVVRESAERVSSFPVICLSQDLSDGAARCARKSCV